MFMAFCPLQIKSLCASLLDSNVLVQRNNLEIVLFFFPFYTCLVSRLCSSRGSAGLPRGHGVGGRDPSRLVRRGRQALGDHCPRSAHFCVGGVSIAESSILPWAACEEPSPFENPLLKIKLCRLVKRVRMSEGQRFTVSSPCSKVSSILLLGFQRESHPPAQI